MNILSKHKKNTQFLLFASLFLMSQGCSQIRPVPMPFETAVSVMANDLFKQVNASQDAVFVIDSFTDADTGEVTDTTKKASEIIKQEKSDFKFTDMTEDNLQKATYVVIGIMQSEQYQEGGAAKYPHLMVSIVDKKSKEIIAHSESWISDTRLASESTPLYKDNPIDIKDANTKLKEDVAKNTSNESAQEKYFDSLGTNALLNEARVFYEKSDYKTALHLYEKAAKRDDGKEIMETYYGLYKCFIKLDNKAAAEQAIDDLVNLGLKNGRINMRFLFASNKTEFLKTEVLDEYPIWIRQIAKKMNDSKSCFHVVGHTSKSGSQDHNNMLSTKRAERIKEMLINEQSGLTSKLKAYGVGSSQCVGCSDLEAQARIDRRVEIKVANCEASK
jgi:outer membrane protein OmpA-like peptidoglycan-associated protein